MTRRYTKTNSFAAGQLDDDLQYRTDIDQIKEGAKVMRNFIPYSAGAARVRWGTRGLITDWDVAGAFSGTGLAASDRTAWQWGDMAEDSKFIPWVREEFNYVIQINVLDKTVFPFTATKVMRIRVINLDDVSSPIIKGNGIVGDDFEFEFEFIVTSSNGTPTGSSTPVQSYGYVQVNNDVIITNHGLPPIRVYSDATSPELVNAEVLSFYDEKSGSGVEVENGSDVVTGIGNTRFSKDFVDGGIIRLLGEDFLIQTVTGDSSMVLVSNWTLPSARIVRPPAGLKYEAINAFTGGDPLGTGANVSTPFSPKDVAFFQNRFVFINDFGTAASASRVVISSAYDPYVIIPAPVPEGPATDAPFDSDLRIGNENELIWVKGGDTIVIGGRSQEYGLTNPGTAFSEGNLLTFRVIGTFGSKRRTNATQYDGGIIFAPQSGGLAEVRYSNEDGRYFVVDITTAHKQITSTITSTAVLDATSVDPVRRIFAAQSLDTPGSTFAIGSAFGDQVAWTANTFARLAVKEVMSIKGLVYFFVWRDNQSKFQVYQWFYGSAGSTAERYSIDGYVNATLVSTVVSPSLITTQTWNTPNPAQWAQEVQLLVHRGSPWIAEDPVTPDGSGNFEIVTYADGVLPEAGDVRVGLLVDAELQPVFPGSADELGESFNRKYRIVSVGVRYMNARQLTINGFKQLPEYLYPTDNPKERPSLDGVATQGLLSGWNEDTTVSIKPTAPYSMNILNLVWEVKV